MDFTSGLFFKTALIGVVMLGLCAVPLWFDSIKKVSHYLFLVGTGGLVGICFIDLLPDVYEMGGRKGLLWVAVVWTVYSAIHYYHYRKKHIKTGHEECHGHGHEDAHHHVLIHADEQGVEVFLGSMMLHCFASGILLAVSTSYSEDFNRTIFFALLTHKAYESLIVSSLILEKVEHRARALFAVFLYAISLPLGALIASVERSFITIDFALVITCIALGTLFGCMVFDFLVPSIQHLKKKPMHFAWVILGLVLTELAMHFSHV